MTRFWMIFVKNIILKKTISCISKFMGILKGKMIFDRSAQMKYKYGNRHFRARGYYVDTAGRNKAALEEDKIMDQMSLKEYIDPFTGKPAEGSK